MDARSQKRRRGVAEETSASQQRAGQRRSTRLLSSTQQSTTVQQGAELQHAQQSTDRERRSRKGQKRLAAEQSAVQAVGPSAAASTQRVEPSLRGQDDDRNHLGHWYVRHAVVVVDETHGPEIESMDGAVGTCVILDESGGAITYERTADSDSDDDNESDDDDGDDYKLPRDKLEGSLKRDRDITLPSGKKVTLLQWQPPPDKTRSQSNSRYGHIGYSDVWSDDKQISNVTDEPYVEVTIEGSHLDCGWNFPRDDFNERADELRAALPNDGLVLCFHWTGMGIGRSASFGVKEFLYLCRAGDVDVADKTLRQQGVAVGSLADLSFIC